MLLYKRILCILLVIIFIIPSSMLSMTAEAAKETGDVLFKAESAPFRGYIVKVRENSQRRVSALNSAGKHIGRGVYFADSLESARSLTDSGNIEYIEPNYILTLMEFPVSPPNDPYFPGSPLNIFGQWNLDMINAEASWRAGLDGNGVKVAVIDTGLVAGHEDIDYNLVLTGTNFTVLPTDANYHNITDISGHGSFVTGIIAAQTDNAAGIASIAEKTQILPLKVFSEGNTDVVTVIEAINEAINQGCDVINMSLGSANTYIDPGKLKSFEDAVNTAASAGIILVAAAGNDGTSELIYPAAFENVIGVGSVNRTGIVSGFSQKNTSVFVTAPGEELASLSCISPSSYRTTGSGTSYSAPSVSAMAILAKQYDKDINISTFKKLLMNAVVDAGDTGYDTSYGYGIVDIEKLVNTELPKPYNINYVLNGGAFAPETNPSAQYFVNSDTITLPIPSKSGYTFNGWYLSPDSDAGPSVNSPVTAIPAGSVGDKTFYAGWIDNNLLNTSITGVSVGGFPGSLNTIDGTYTVYMPAGTTPTASPADVLVTAESPDATYVAATADLGFTWTVTVTSANGISNASYTIYVNNTTYHAPSVRAELVPPTGTPPTGMAVPASSDGIIPAVTYVVENVASWFTDEDAADLLSCSIVSTSAQGIVAINSNQLVYTPNSEDENKNIEIVVRANDGRFDSTSNVTAAISVGPLPASTSIIYPTTAVFDKYAESEDYIDITVSMTLYGNILTAIRNGDSTLSDASYIVNGDSSAVIIKKEYLSTLVTGEITLTFEFNKGNPSYANIDVTISDSTPVSTPTPTPSSTPTPTPTPTTPPPPPGGGFAGFFPPPPQISYLEVVCNTEIVKIPYTKKDSLLFLEITESIENALLQEIRRTGELMLDISGIAGADSVMIPLATIRAMARTVAGSIDNGHITVKMLNGKVRFDNLALNSIVRQLSGDITIALKSVDFKNLTPDQQTSVDSAPVFDLFVMNGDNKVTYIDKGTVDIWLTYAFQAGMNSAAIMIHSLDSSGELISIPSTYNKINNTVSFSVNKFSCYVISYDLLYAWKNPFLDVSKDDWYYNAVRFVNYRRLFFGVSDSAFSPEVTMNRAMFVTVLGRMSDATVNHNTKSSFSDVVQDGWSTGYITWAVNNLIIEGYGDGTFGQYDIITQEQMAIILFNYAKYMNLSVSNTDSTLLLSNIEGLKTHDWALNAMAWAMNNGLIDSRGENACAPLEYMSRSHVAAVLQRFYEKVIIKGAKNE